MLADAEVHVATAVSAGLQHPGFVELKLRLGRRRKVGGTADQSTMAATATAPVAEATPSEPAAPKDKDTVEE